MEDLANVFKTKLGLLQPSAIGQQPAMLETPVMLGHMIDDEIIDIELGREACEVLQGLGMKVSWQEYHDGGHLGMMKTVGLDAIVAFLKGLMDMEVGL